VKKQICSVKEEEPQFVDGGVAVRLVIIYRDRFCWGEGGWIGWYVAAEGAVPIGNTLWYVWFETLFWLQKFWQRGMLLFTKTSWRS